MAPTLPRELISLVIRELFADADKAVYESRDAVVEAFSHLRLVARHIKADAHAAWPGGLAHLANNASQRMLHVDVTPDAFRRHLDEARQVLQHTKSLDFGFDRDGTQEELLGYDTHAWLRGVRQIVAATRALDKLGLDVAEADLAFRQLRLADLRLRELHLWGGTQWALVGLDLSRMDTLEVLEVGQTGEGAGSLERFRLPPRASSIQLSWMRLSSNDVDMLGLESNINLRHLDLTGCRINRPLPTMPALKKLILSDAAIDDRVLPSLASWSTLEELDLSDNAIADASPLALATNTVLKRLVMSDTRMRDAAAFQLKSNSGLRVLDVGGCPFTSLAFGLASNRTLRELLLRRCRFTVPLMQQLAGELAGNATLSKLDLGFCNLTDEEMAHFKLEKTSGLEELDLFDNSALSDDGLQPLADSIVKHALLRMLDLSFCTKVTAPFLVRLQSPGRTILQDDD